ncbi:MAG: hypothetical protein M1334_03575 [Patescibacteria group bacterium]|nr:hypothetical protein [Patescibacteria group bacterium]
MENNDNRIKKLISITTEGRMKWKMTNKEIIKGSFQWIKLTAEYENQVVRLEAFLDLDPKEIPNDLSEITKNTDFILTFQTGELLRLSIIEKFDPSVKKMRVHSTEGALDILRLFIYAYSFAVS